MPAPVVYSYPPDVERWDKLLRQYFPPEAIGKAKWVIRYESGGAPDAKGDFDPVRGIYAARGLFQIQSSANFPDRPDAAWLDVAENNIAYAARMYASDRARGGTGFGDWGEGRTYQGKPFGALGSHPYPGDPPGLPPPTAATAATTDPSLGARLAAFESRLAAFEAFLGGTDAIRAWNASGNSLALGYASLQRTVQAIADNVVTLARAAPAEAAATRYEVANALERIAAELRAGPQP